MKTEKKNKLFLITGIAFLVLFAVWTVLIVTVDVQPVGRRETNVGFATFNTWFHQLTGSNKTLYEITDWLGLLPFAICALFAVIGLIQMIARKSLLKVDTDILALGVFYVAVIGTYFLFEKLALNYRPIIIKGKLEASYPSSTTLLVLSVMPTLIYQITKRIAVKPLKYSLNICSVLFSAFMLVGRVLSGVHWITDIIGSVFFCVGIVLIYLGTVSLFNKGENKEISENKAE